MPRGRKPLGDQALSNAQRQARYRARRAAAKPLPASSSRRRIRPPSRPQRWHAAVGVLIAVQAEYAAWYDALPESLQSSPTAEALRAIVELDLDELAAIDPPRGYGRD
jgi:hypothetical protein